jgi:glutamyl-tRNA synthetase
MTLAGMADHFEPRHLQRASAQFDSVQLRHWQGLWARSLSPQAALDWLSPYLPADMPPAQREASVAALLPNIVSADDVRAWLPVIRGEELQFEDDARAAVGAAGPEFFRVTAAAVGEQADLAAMRAASGLKGAAFYAPLRAALTGRLNGPELAPLLKAMSPQLVRERLASWSRQGLA